MQCDELKSLLLNRQTGVKLGSAVVLTGIVSYLKFRPIAILVSSVYATWIYRTFYSNYRIHVPQELTARCKALYQNLRELRENKPNVFCGFITSILFLLAVIGNVVNGTYILFVCLIAGVFVTSKYEIKIIKENVESPPCSGNDIDEFCPSLDEVNMRILKQIGDHADDTSLYSKTNDNSMAAGGLSAAAADNDSDSDNDLLPKDAVIPEHDELDLGGGGGFDSFDPLGGDGQNLVLTQSAEYKRKHFSNTSSESSDSDDSITRGLDFKNIPVTATIEPHSSPSASQHDLLTNLQHTVARNLIENITTAAVGHILEMPMSSQRKNNYDSDDDSDDFEILDSEEIPK